MTRCANINNRKTVMNDNHMGAKMNSSKWNKLLLSIFAVLLFTFTSTSFAQSYLMSLKNGVQVDANTYKFDVTMQSTGADFALDSYQCVFTFNKDIVNGGNLTFTYVSASSQLNNEPAYGIGINTVDGEQKLTFASSPAGNDVISSTEKKVGTFVLKNSKAMGTTNYAITWSFTGNVNTILTSENSKVITNPDYHQNLSTGGVTAVENSENTPKDYRLYQNYPNPFNPSTSIKYALPFESNVTIVVFNTLGQEVDKLVNQVQKPGNHQLTWNATQYASGTYIFSIEAKAVDGSKTFKSTKKMMLLK